LNLLHFGWAFLAQCGTGLILEQWSTEGGHRTILAYQVAFSVNVALQVAALVWFALPALRSFAWWMGSIPLFMPVSVSVAVEPVISYEQTVVLLPMEGDAEW
jgi:hypothetical protein